MTGDLAKAPDQEVEVQAGPTEVEGLSGAASATVRASSQSLLRQLLVPTLLVVLFAAFPYMDVPIPWLLPGTLNSPGSMQLLSTCLVIGGIALSYDILFGRTGLMSFGHAIFVGVGSYAFTIMLGRYDVRLAVGVSVALAVGLVVALLFGVISLQVKGMAFTMVTLAIAEAVAVGIARNPGRLTGGEDGLPMSVEHLPALLIGVLNAPYRYWVALAFCALSWLVVIHLDRSRVGRTWAAIRENEVRVEALGVSSFRAKLIAILVAGLIGTCGGMVNALLVSGSSTDILSLNYTLALLLIVVLGGVGSKYGALIGAFVYTLLDNRLIALARSETVQDLPTWLRAPLSQPLFLFGVIFILIVYFAPGGLASFSSRLRHVRSSRS